MMKWGLEKTLHPPVSSPPSSSSVCVCREEPAGGFGASPSSKVGGHFSAFTEDTCCVSLDRTSLLFMCSTNTKRKRTSHAICGLFVIIKTITHPLAWSWIEQKLLLISPGNSRLAAARRFRLLRMSTSSPTVLLVVPQSLSSSTVTLLPWATRPSNLLKQTATN